MQFRSDFINQQKILINLKKEDRVFIFTRRNKVQSDFV